MRLFQSGCPAVTQRSLLIRAAMLLTICSAILMTQGCSHQWRRNEQAHSPWNSATKQAAKYEKSNGDFLYGGTIDRWETADGEMVPYWPPFSAAIDCFKHSKLLEPIMRDFQQHGEATSSPYHLYLVSIEPAVIVVSEQKPRPFDPWRMFVLPSTRIPESKTLYWFQPDSHPEPVRIELDGQGSGSFDVQQTRINIHRNADNTIDVTRASRPIHYVLSESSRLSAELGETDGGDTSPIGLRTE